LGFMLAKNPSCAEKSESFSGIVHLSCASIQSGFLLP
jgi:hypothetical protein